VTPGCAPRAASYSLPTRYFRRSRSASPAADLSSDEARSSPGYGADSRDVVGLTQAARQERRSASRLWHLLRKSLGIAWNADRRLVSITAGLQLLAGLIALLQILVVERVLSRVLSLQNGHGSIDQTVLPVAVLALIVGFSAVSGAAQQQLQRLLAELVSRHTWAAILDVSTSVELRQYDTPGFYDHLQRVQTNAVGRPFQLTQAVISFVGTFASSVGLAAAVIALQPILLPLLLVSGLPLYASVRRGGNLEFAFAVAQTPKLRLRSYFQMVQTGRDEAKELRAFGTSRALRARYDHVYSAYLEALRHHIRRRSVIAVVSGFGSAAVLAFTMFAIVWLVAHHHLSLAAAGAALVAVRLLAGQINGLFSSVQQIFESGLFLEDLDRFLATEVPQPPDRAGRSAPETFERLDVEDLSFTYPGAETPALSDIDLHLHRGQVVALVGENGSGKTTLAKLLAALYQPDSGTISWDGVDVSEYNQADLRLGVGVIFQDFVHYHLSAKTNIGLGRPDPDEADPAIAEAARRAGAASAIEALPLGYDTILSKMFSGGHELSGGQWQRVAIARAFYRDAPFVILDEPSAALDPRAEYELFTSLRRLLVGRTVLYISHRLSTVRDADCIYVLSAGSIAESGTHDELIANAGLYAELFALQANAYADRPE
jgi:ATP-binding cassette, subfamily B, bacterial